MGLAVGAASSASSTSPQRVLNRLVDELHGRGELPRLVVLIYAAGPSALAVA